MSVVGVDIINKRGERRKYLPLEIRAKMYDDVIELRKQGLKYKEIQRRIYEKYGKQISRPLISYWVNRKHKPLGKVNKFDEKPSPKLEYVIGAMFSDAYKYFNDENYRLGLTVIDKEFAEEFGKCLAKVLGRRKPYEPYWNENKKQWVVVGCSIQLFEFLNRPLEELRPYIEHCKDCVASFLRALFDAEGSIYVKIREGKKQRMLRLYNTNKELLIYAKYLLKKYFDIDATGPHLTRKSGKIFNFPNGKITKTTRDYYSIYIRTNSLLDFYKHIGFTIKRKQQNLIEAIKK
jgi:intein-encoded DNA endonuclease-like protein